MRVGQPRVEREHRHLDGEADEHSGEDPDLSRATEQTAVFGEHRNRERRLDAVGQRAADLEEQGDERHQHESRTEHGVKEELERRVLTLLTTPDADHEVHRQEHHFEEHEEQDQVLSDEGSGHARLEDEHEDEEGLRIARRRNVVPGVDHHQNRDDHRQDVERQAHSVESDRVVARDDLDPLGVGEELQRSRLVVVELGEGVDADSQGGHCGREGHQLVQLLVGLGNEQHHQHTDHRQECADGQ